MAEVRSRIERRLARLGLSVSTHQLDQLGKYFGLLTKWNERLNLTALQLLPPSSEAIDRLVCEPVAASESILATEGLLMDLGSGGGSPAIPLKIMNERIRLVMVEAKTRKCAFLRDAARQLGLSSVEVANARFEELLTRIDLHEEAEVVSLRAVRADDNLWRTIQGFLKPDGTVLWFTTADEVAKTLPPAFAVDSSRSLPSSTSSRLVILRRRA